MNDYSTLDAQDEISTFAQLSPEETNEANSYYDELQAKADAALEIEPVSSAWPGLTSDERYAAKMDFLLDVVHVEIGAKLAERWHQSALLEKEPVADSACHGLRVGDEVLA